MLLRTYDLKWVLVLRYLLILLTAFTGISVVLDSHLPPLRFQAALTSLVFPTAYAIYFFVSKRVRSVFIERVWSRGDCVEACDRVVAAPRLFQHGEIGEAD